MRNVPLTQTHPPCHAPCPLLHVYVKYTFFRAHCIFPFHDKHSRQESSLHMCYFVPKTCCPNLTGWPTANHGPPLSLKSL